MIITHLSATNWRNFQQINVPLSVRQFIVGPNASGKSNFLDIFRFLQELQKMKAENYKKRLPDVGA